MQSRKTLQTVADADGERTGFQGRRYKTRLLAESSYRDSFEDYLAFLAPRLEQARRLLAGEGTFYFHIDYRESHHCKLLLDEIFGRDCFLNEIVWAYDYGARSKRRWPAKHDTILVYVKRPLRLLLRLRACRPRALHGSGAGHPREGSEGQAAHGRLVAHDRAHQRAREDRLPHPEARGHHPPHGRRLPRARATGALTSSPVAAPSEPWPPRSVATTC